MNPAPFTANAAGPWTQVRQGDKEFAPALGKTVLCQVRAGDQAWHFCAKLKLHGSERVWQWLEGMEPHGLVAFERVHAWAEIKAGPRCARPGETDEAARNAALPNPS